MYMRDDWSWDGPALREETRTAQGRALDLLFIIVGVSILLGLSISLFSSWLFQALSGQQVLLFIIIGICVVILLLIIIVFVPRILTTIKEFHQEIEIPLPLFASKQDVEVIRVRYYDNVTDLLHDALARHPAQERRRITQILQSIRDNDAAARQEIVVFVLELIQFLFATQVVRGSARLLGPQAAFHKFREVIELQSSTVTSKWDELASQVPNNHYLQDTLQGVPQKIILPGGVDLHLPDIAQEMSGKIRSDHAHTPKLAEVTLLKAIVGHDTALGITAIAAFSEHGLPKLNAPRLGLTARCILRNARDQRLHDLACEEEQVAAQLNDEGQALHLANQGESDPVGRYASLYKKLYTGDQQPYLLRVFVRFDGTFRIRQLGRNEKRLYGLYAWGTELARLLAHMDIAVFMATLKDDGQKTPHRMF